MLGAGLGRGRPSPDGRTSIGPLFTTALTRSAILPGDGNYRDYLNAGIIAMTMNGTRGHGPTALRLARACDSQACGNRR